ncbi:MAG: hypothetical protein HY507_00320 [Candidatus Zambryskibacteria bacterium]|nr:hypothetical protein [Candidatus Zambryskibacteria bacterium]
MKKNLDLRIYDNLIETIRQFKKHYGLSSSIRKVDWFLWSYGKNFLSENNSGLRNKKRLLELLKKPTDQLIGEYAGKVNTTERYYIGDKALRKLLEHCPNNHNLEAVWLKVIVINNLYSAGVIDTFKIANHIVKISNFDKKVENADVSLIEEIRKGHGIKREKTGNEIDFYSFATKYCSEHSPGKYPIYDQYVSKMHLLYRDKIAKELLGKT